MRIKAGFETIVSSLQGDANRDAVPRGGIVIDSLSKRFRKHTVVRKSYSTIKTSLLTRLFRARYPKDNYVAALERISFTVAPGRSLGVIGSNGSGKSTLLKLIAGIYRPDEGTVRTNGKISALIELGAGFHPDFTGRENVYLGGVMYGLTRAEINARFDSIVSYAELEEFIDDPVRTYSSGMYMRLGFSLAVHTDPDILLIDEVLAVGDAAFIHRCHDTISEFKRQGKTLLFVTHDLDAVARWCDEAVWLEKGRIASSGEPRFVIDSYLERVAAREEVALAAANAERGAVSREEERATSHIDAGKRWGSGDVSITNVRLLGTLADAKWIFDAGAPLTIEVTYRVSADIGDDLVVGVGIVRADGLVVHGSNTDIDGVTPPSVRGTDVTYRYVIERLDLLEGTYYVDVAAHAVDGTPYDYHHLCYKFSVRSGTRQQGVFNPPHRWEFEAAGTSATAVGAR